MIIIECDTMINKVKKEIIKFKNNIDDMEKQISNIDINVVLKIIKNRIKENIDKYFSIEDIQEKKIIKKELIKYYNLLYYYQAKVNGLERVYILDNEIEQLSNIYMLEQLPKLFEINENLLSEINVSNGLTMEQTLELLQWTVNNTRKNLMIDGNQRIRKHEDVYGNSCLAGTCGLSQFSTLYPLKQLGLEVTVNNIDDMCGIKHAYGTVLIPIKTDDKIVNKRFLIDCTYRQFFTLPFNVVSRYLSDSPSVGFFVSQEKEYIDFANKLLKNGFVFASLENMKLYFGPFFYSSILVDNIYDMDEKFDEIDILEIVDKKQSEFDYTKEEFDEWGLNLDFSFNKNKNLK